MECLDPDQPLAVGAKDQNNVFHVILYVSMEYKVLYKGNEHSTKGQGPLHAHGRDPQFSFLIIFFYETMHDI